MLCGVSVYCVMFFFKQKTAYEMRISDWSSDVCSSDLNIDDGHQLHPFRGGAVAAQKRAWHPGDAAQCRAYKPGAVPVVFRAGADIRCRVDERLRAGVKGSDHRSPGDRKNTRLNSSH